MIIYLKSHSGVAFRSKEKVLHLKGDGLINQVEDNLWEQVYQANKANIDYLKSNGTIVVSKMKDDKASIEVSEEATKEAIEKQEDAISKNNIKKVK